MAVLLDPHRLFHDRVVTLEKTGSGELVFRDRSGRGHRARPLLTASGDGIEKVNRARGVEVTPETCLPGWGGEEGNLAYVADLALRDRYPVLREAGVIEPDQSDEEWSPSERDGPDP